MSTCEVAVCKLYRMKNESAKKRENSICELVSLCNLVQSLTPLQLTHTHSHRLLKHLIDFTFRTVPVGVFEVRCTREFFNCCINNPLDSLYSLSHCGLHGCFFAGVFFFPFATIICIHSSCFYLCVYVLFLKVLSP